MAAPVDPKQANQQVTDRFYDQHFGTQQGARQPEPVVLGAIKHYDKYIPKGPNGRREKSGWTVGFTVQDHLGVEVHTHLSDDAGLEATSVQTPHLNTNAQQRSERGRRRFSLHAQEALFPQMQALVDQFHSQYAINPRTYLAKLPGMTKAEETAANAEWAQFQEVARAKAALARDSPPAPKRELAAPLQPGSPRATSPSEFDHAAKKARPDMQIAPNSRNVAAAHVFAPVLAPSAPVLAPSAPVLAPSLPVVRQPISFSLAAPVKRAQTTKNVFGF